MLHYQIKGNHPKQIIFLHGNSQSIEVWDTIINTEILNAYTLIAADLPGHGKSFVSTQPDKDYGLQGMAAHLKEFIFQHSNNEYIVVANSGATNLIGEIAHLLNNCKGVFLLGASVIGEHVSPADILKPNPNITPFFTPNPTEEELDKLIDDGAYSINDSNKKKYKEIFREADPAFRQYWFASISNGEWTDEIKNLNTLNIPVAVIYGENDNFYICSLFR